MIQLFFHHSSWVHLFSDMILFRFMLRELAPIVLGINLFFFFFFSRVLLSSIFSCSPMSEMSPKFDLISIFNLFLFSDLSSFDVIAIFYSLQMVGLYAYILEEYVQSQGEEFNQN